VPSDSDPEKWDYPPHTKAKHDMLASYLDGWYPILASWEGKLLFLDGFAGRGRYVTGEEGSPIIALKRLLDHRSFPHGSNGVESSSSISSRRTRKTPTYLSKNSRISKQAAPSGPTPSSIASFTHPSMMQQPRSYRTSANKKRQLAPTFAFIDPFRIYADANRTLLESAFELDEGTEGQQRNDKLYEIAEYLTKRTGLRFDADEQLVEGPWREVAKYRWLHKDQTNVILDILIGVAVGAGTEATLGTLRAGMMMLARQIKKLGHESKEINPDEDDWRGSGGYM
jgi:hypothetical protein